MASRSNRTLFRRRAPVVVALGALAVFACSSSPPSSTQEPKTGVTSQALSGSSCQALDIALKKDAKLTGATSYAIDTSGRVFGWGANEEPLYPLGSLALGTPVKTPVPLGVSNAVRLAAGRFGACAIVNGVSTSGGLENGGVMCWGKQPGGPNPQPKGLGLETPKLITSDQTDEPIFGVTAISYGDLHVCALRNDTTVWCWGDDEFGQLGDSTEAGPRQPGLATILATRMLNVAGVTQVAAAGSSTCILRTLPTGVGEVDCLGDNQFGQLGQGTMGERNFEPIPTPIVFTGGSPSFVALYGGGAGTFCATAATAANAQTTYCWGANDHAQAAIVNQLATPGPFPISTDVGALWAQGDLNGCEANAGGAVSCWGGNFFGKIPGVTSPQVNANTPIAGLANVLRVSVGETHLCALSTDSLACWGRNANGEIGNGTTGDATPVTRLFLSVPDIVCGSGNVGDTCGVNTNACATKDCGACTPLNRCDAATHKCVDDPTKCAQLCASDSFCNQHVCVTYCGNQAPDTLLPLSGQGATVTSPSTYGANNCGSYVIDVTNASAFTNESLVVGPASRPNDSATCTNSRVTIAYYKNQQQFGASQQIVGQWRTSPGFGYCTWGSLGSDGIWTTMPAVSSGDLRVVVKAENAFVSKGQVTWSLVPVKAIFFDACNNGIADQAETGVDCGGPTCRPCGGGGGGGCGSNPCP